MARSATNKRPGICSQLSTRRPAPLPGSNPVRVWVGAHLRSSPLLPRSPARPSSRGWGVGGRSSPGARTGEGEPGSALPSPASVPASLRWARCAGTAGAESGSGGASPARAPARSSQLPQPIRGQRRLRRRAGRARRGEVPRAGARARRGGSSATQPRRSAAVPAPRATTQRGGRTRPPITAPAAPRPARAPAPADKGAGGSDLKTHSPEPRPDRRPERGSWPGGDGWPHLPGPASSFRPPTQHGRKVWGGGDRLGSQFLFPSH